MNQDKRRLVMQNAMQVCVQEILTRNVYSFYALRNIWIGQGKL